MEQAKIAIIGAGVVGSTTAYTLMMRNLASKIILVDPQDSRCAGEVADLSDAIPFSNTCDVVKGTLLDEGQADIVIITAGAAQKPGQSRRDLLKINNEIIKQVIEGMKPLNPHMVIIVVTNPVDSLTYTAQKISGLPTHQVFGSGTLLDTQRLRLLISKKITVAQQSIHVYVLGEHGDSQFVPCSSARIADIPLTDFPGLNKNELQHMAEQSKQKAYDIIACKGSTAFGISSCLAAYCQNIIFDAKRVTPVSCYVKEFDICLSMPAVLGKGGVEQILIPEFKDEEKAQLHDTVMILKEMMQGLVKKREFAI